MTKKLLPPGPKPIFTLGNIFAFRRDMIGFLKKLANEYGDAAHFKLGPLNAVLFNHPDLIREVLSAKHDMFVKGRPLEMAKALLGEGILTSEGLRHDKHYKMIRPAFHREKLRSYGPVIVDTARGMMEEWEEGMTIDILTEMTRFSTVISGKVLFSEDVSRKSSEIMEALNVAKDLFARVPVPFAEHLLKLPLPANLRFFRAKAKLDNLIYGLIEKRHKSAGDHDDLLTLLMYPYGTDEKEGGLTDEAIRDEALTLFLTAFDTTSTALTWTFYLLSQHAEVREELQEELNRVLGDRKADISDLDKLSFTRKVFTESMRLFPPSYVIVRQAIGEVEIGAYSIPKDTLILLSPYLIHRDSRYYPEPEKFDPHHWDEGRSAEITRYMYFPFSAGPRKCIGEPLAWMEGILLLATVCQKWNFKLVPGHKVELLPLINLIPKHGMKMTLTRRNHHKQPT